MRALTARELIYAWEMGQGKHWLEQALILLALALPEADSGRLRTLPLGQRNMLLLLLRQKTLGTQAMGFVKCPRCNESLEFTIDTTALLPTSAEDEFTTLPPTETIHDLEIDGCTLRFRMPTSLDLAEVLRCRDHVEGRQVLISRCVVAATAHGQSVESRHLSQTAVQALADAIAEHDPLVEIDLAMNCSTCQYSWTAILDIVSFFWTELDALAKRLLRDVHTIASAYGWRESDILALGAARRQFYLELIR